MFETVRPPILDLSWDWEFQRIVNGGGRPQAHRLFFRLWMRVYFTVGRFAWLIKPVLCLSKLSITLLHVFFFLLLCFVKNEIASYTEAKWGPGGERVWQSMEKMSEKGLHDLRCPTFFFRPWIRSSMENRERKGTPLWNLDCEWDFRGRTGGGNGTAGMRRKRVTAALNLPHILDAHGSWTALLCRSAVDKCVFGSH